MNAETGVGAACGHHHDLTLPIACPAHSVSPLPEGS